MQGQGNLTSSAMYGDMDPQRFRGLPRGSLNTKDGQSVANDVSIGSPMQSASSKVSFNSYNYQLILLSLLCPRDLALSRTTNE